MQPDYKDYVEGDFHDEYVRYQARYRGEPRASDVVLLRLIEEAVQDGAHTLLDIGCSTGNLLYHVREKGLPLELTGGELADVQLEACRHDEALSGIEFEKMDICELGLKERYDIIVSNAVISLIGDEDYGRALHSVAEALRPGGRFLAFEWMHPFPADLAILERSEWHPDGMVLHFRSYDTVRRLLIEAGFVDVRLEPFRIPYDLSDERAMELHSYTVRAESGERMLFRGTLYQPWCHLVARKA